MFLKAYNGDGRGILSGSFSLLFLRSRRTSSSISYHALASSASRVWDLSNYKTCGFYLTKATTHMEEKTIESIWVHTHKGIFFLLPGLSFMIFGDVTLAVVPKYFHQYRLNV